MENTSTQVLVPNKKMMPVGELFGKSFGIYKKKIKLLATIAAINVPVLIIALLINATDPFSHMPFILFLFYMVVSAWSGLSLIFAIKERESNLTAGQLLKLGWSKFASYIWIYVLITIVIVAGFILFIIPGVIFMIWFSFAIYIFVAEGIKGNEALKASKKLTKGYWWAIFGRFLLLGIGIIVVTILSRWIPVIGPLFTILVISPFSVIYGYIMYEDLKTIKSS